MAIERAIYINQLKETNPAPESLVKEGDNHLRLIKKVLRSTFFKVDESIKISADTLNELVNYKTYIDEKLKEKYPVGVVYSSTVDVDPSTTIGFGVWEKFSEGRVLVGAGSSVDEAGNTKTFTAGETGGVYGHKLAPEELPNHTHEISLKDTNLGNKIFPGSSALNHRHYYMMDDNTSGSEGIIGNIRGSLLMQDGGADGGGSLHEYIMDAQGYHNHTIHIGSHTHSVSISDFVGGDEAHPNIQPFLTIYRWKRTS